MLSRFKREEAFRFFGHLLENILLSLNSNGFTFLPFYPFTFIKSVARISWNVCP